MNIPKLTARPNFSEGSEKAIGKHSIWDDCVLAFLAFSRDMPCAINREKS